MMARTLDLCLLGILVLVVSQAASAAAEVDLALQEQQALQAAAQSVADSVVQITTVGGLDRVGRTLITQGPTTGLVVTADGYIVSSAFNFVQQPTSILIRLPSGKQAPARLVAHDRNRMLVLLKVEVDEPLRVPEAAPSDEIRVGQWALAVGRTFRADRVGVSVGIVSALNRMYGRVIQTDASVSVANYGGPLVDLQGRVLGVLVPMSPQSAGGEGSELAGAEFYDSGIGFAVPLEHVFGVLNRWQEGKDLLSGKLGVGLKAGGAHFEPPEITTVWQGSPAAKAGWQPKDMIVAVDGVSVSTQSQLRFLLVPRYAGDHLRLTIRRGDEEINSEVTLTGELAPFRHAFLGVLPMRDAPEKDEPGVTLRGVWPESPAARAGLKRGDRIVKIGETKVTDQDSAQEALDGLSPGSSVQVHIERNKKQRTPSTKLTTLPEAILTRRNLPEAHSDSREETEKDQQAELKPLKLLEFVQIARYYTPPQDEDHLLGLLLWLADGDLQEDDAIVGALQAACRRDGLLLVIAHSQDDAGWSAEEAEFLNTLLRTVSGRFDIDPRRAVIFGRGKAGQLAFALAFNRKSELSGAIAIDASLPRTLRLPPTVPNRRLALLTIESKNSSFAPLIRKDIEQLREAGYPTTWLERPTTEGNQLEPKTLGSITRWIDGLDRF